jgi:hypothetical protein
MAKMGRCLISLLLLSILTIVLSSATASSRGLGQSESTLHSFAAAATPALILTAPSTSQPPNRTIDIELSITGATNIAAFEFDLEYDRTLVQLAGITPHNFLGVTSGCVPSASRCVVALGPLDQGSATSVGGYSYGTGPGANDDGVLAILHFQPTGAEGTVTLHLINPLLVDIAAVPTIPVTQDATLVLAAPIASPTPTEPSMLKRYLPAIRR